MRVEAHVSQWTRILHYAAVVVAVIIPHVTVFTFIRCLARMAAHPALCHDMTWVSAHMGASAVMLVSRHGRKGTCIWYGRRLRFTFPPS